MKCNKRNIFRKVRINPKKCRRKELVKIWTDITEMEYEYAKENQSQNVVQLRDEKLIVLWRNWLLKKVGRCKEIREMIKEWDQDGDIGGFWTSLLLQTPKCTAVRGVIPCERNPETMWVTPTHWVNENINTGEKKKKKKAETHCPYKL